MAACYFDQLSFLETFSFTSQTLHITEKLRYGTDLTAAVNLFTHSYSYFACWMCGIRESCFEKINIPSAACHV